MKKVDQDPAYFQQFSRRTSGYWIRVLLGGGLSIGALCKAADTVSRINTDNILRAEIIINQGYLEQYFHELTKAVGGGSVPISQTPEIIIPTLTMLCLVPITLGLAGLARRAGKKNK